MVGAAFLPLNKGQNMNPHHHHLKKKKKGWKGLIQTQFKHSNKHAELEKY